ncbi:hypothetical protein KV097_01395 [Mumia sp. zg.B17]|uniref:hypothetical protein n=1 Tax=unclassified Mumia TaxID=2621872 RepID=UPI001C6ED8F6|nr:MULTISPECIES: hypothetical protein [unclassified Mumia]MBW9204582.1 hypothetical protein [Mumia sp. zg.B17]MBW9209413.1 hypothetical protein [Mumia sp. zg.B21]
MLKFARYAKGLGYIVFSTGTFFMVCGQWVAAAAVWGLGCVLVVWGFIAEDSPPRDLGD